VTKRLRDKVKKCKASAPRRSPAGLFFAPFAVFTIFVFDAFVLRARPTVGSEIGRTQEEGSRDQASGNRQ